MPFCPLYSPLENTPHKARVVCVAFVAALVAPFEMTAERRGAAAFDGAQHTLLPRGQRSRHALGETRRHGRAQCRRLPVSAAPEDDALRFGINDGVREQIQWAGGGADRAGSQAEIAGRGGQDCGDPAEVGFCGGRSRLRANGRHRRGARSAGSVASSDQRVCWREPRHGRRPLGSEVGWEGCPGNSHSRGRTCRQ